MCKIFILTTSSATYFGWMSSVSYIVNLLGPGVAGLTMGVTLWLPFLISICLLLLAVPVISFLPGGDAPHRSASSSATEDEEQRRPLMPSPILKAQRSDPSLWRLIRARVSELRTTVASHPRNLVHLLISFFLTSLASADTRLLPQYISKRYHWTFASAGYLLSGKAVVNFLLLTLVVPGILHRSTAASTRDPLRAAQMQSAVSDGVNARYARLCLAVSVLGALAIALAGTVWLLFPSLLVYALGSALPVFTLSLLKSPAVSPSSPNHDRSQNRERSPEDGTRDVAETHLFSIVMMVRTLGSLVGAPLMALLWVRAIAVGGAGTGIPYFVSAACYVAAIVVFAGIDIRRG